MFFLKLRVIKYWYILVLFAEIGVFKGFVTSVMNDTIKDEYVAELETSPSSYGHFDDEIGL